MEKHFLRVLSGSALACSPVEKEWLAFYERWRSVQGDEQPEHAYEDDDYGALDDETAETMREIVEESLEYADGYARSDDEGWFYSDD